MKNLILTFIIALYEGASMIWAFNPLDSTIFVGVDEKWVSLNRVFLGQVSYLNLLLAIVILCMLCYNQGLQDGKNLSKLIKN